eukprot:6064205-Pyramimonas_sp.AAC.1
MWAVLAWLSILAFRNPDPNQPLVGVEQVTTEFWAEFGRNYYVRYDYEVRVRNKQLAKRINMSRKTHANSPPQHANSPP